MNAFIVAVKQLIEFQEEIAGLRRELAGRSDFSVESLFFEMDSEQKGELTRQEFRDAVEGKKRGVLSSRLRAGAGGVVGVIIF